MSSAALCHWEFETPSFDAIWKPIAEDSSVDQSSCADASELEINSRLEEEIDRAFVMLEGEDPDDIEDGVRHSVATLNRAVLFLQKESEVYEQWFGKIAPVPSIDLGPNGSIDIHWKTPNRELLINIPADAIRKATFYGDNDHSDMIKGSFDPDTVDSRIALWLTGE